MISENLAREWWGNPAAAVGKRIRENPKDPWREIVGVAADVYDNGVQAPAPKFAYWPALMDHYAWIGGGPFVVRTAMYASRSNPASTQSLLTEARHEPRLRWFCLPSQGAYRAAALASYLPSRRATGIDPVQALRAE